MRIIYGIAILFLFELNTGFPQQITPMDNALNALFTSYTLASNLTTAESSYLIDMVQTARNGTDTDVPLILSALNRIRELRLTEAAVSVRDLIDTCVPGEDLTCTITPGYLRDVYYLALYTMGTISTNNDDADTLYTYFQGRANIIESHIIIHSLGIMKNSSKAVASLNAIMDSVPYTTSLRDNNEIVNSLLDAVDNQNSRMSLPYLNRFMLFYSRNPDLTKKALDLQVKISKNGI